MKRNAFGKPRLNHQFALEVYFEHSWFFCPNSLNALTRVKPSFNQFKKQSIKPNKLDFSSTAKYNEKYEQQENITFKNIIKFLAVGLQ